MPLKKMSTEELRRCEKEFRAALADLGGDWEMLGTWAVTWGEKLLAELKRG